MKNFTSLNSSIKFKLALFLSFSFTATSYSFPPFLPFFPNPDPDSQPKPSRRSFLPLPPPPPSAAATATAGDILSLLGPEEVASKIDANEAEQLWSCLKFLVPFRRMRDKRRSMVNLWRFDNNTSREDFENEMIWWPPSPVLELARLAVDSAGDSDVIYLALDPTVIPVPDVEGSKEAKCELTRTPYGRRFISEELNSYLAFLFEIIASRGPSVGLNVSLSCYDFFHGHLFLAKDTGRLGILFHAKEYPAYDKELFPFNMGYCQIGSDVAYDNSMNFRNILWLAPLPSNSDKSWVAPGVLVVLDAHPGGIIYRDIVPDYVQIARTIYEDDFGEVPVDVNYLNTGDTSPNYQLFIC